MYEIPDNKDKSRFDAHKSSRESLSPLNDIALIRSQIERMLRERPDDPSLIKAVEAAAKLTIAAQKELTKHGELFTKEEFGHALGHFADLARDSMKPLCLALIDAYPGDEVILNLHDSLCSAIAGELGNEHRKEIAQREVLMLRERAEQSKKRKPRLT